MDKGFCFQMLCSLGGRSVFSRKESKAFEEERPKLSVSSFQPTVKGVVVLDNKTVFCKNINQK